MKVLMIASEAVPFAKTGGLADVVSSLSERLTAMGHDSRVLLPRYSFIDTQHLDLVLEDLQVPLAFSHEQCAVYASTLPGNSAAMVYLLDHPFFSNRGGLYGEKGGHTYRDNHRRFTLLSRAALSICSRLPWKPDIFHAHDWQSALVPAFLKEFSNDEFSHSGSVLTIHNIGYQGQFSKHDLHVTQLNWEDFHPETHSTEQQLNFLKSGILNADAITTVSPTYAKEIRTPQFGHGMEALLERRRDTLAGILNGVDYNEWNPQNDPHIPRPFNAEDLSGKAEAKRALQEKVDLPVSSEVPLIGLVSRLVSQKGFYELCDPQRGSLKRICDEMSIQMVILGTGEDWIEKQLLHLDAVLPNLKVFNTFSNSMAHLIEAGADLFLMPSRYEPCGLNQIYSLRYGTLPVVRRTGGLADTVENCTPETGAGTGFLFDELSPESIYGTLTWAVSMWYEQPELFRTMQRRAMSRHFSWDDSAEEYVRLYSRILSGSSSA